MNNGKRDGKEYYPDLNPKLVISHMWNTACISHHDTWRKDCVWRKPIHKMNKIFIRGYFSSHKVFCGNFHSRKEKLSAPYKCIGNTVKSMKRDKGLSYSGKHTLCIVEKNHHLLLLRNTAKCCFICGEHLGKLVAEPRNKTRSKNNSEQFMHTMVHQEGLCLDKLGVRGVKEHTAQLLRTRQPFGDNSRCWTFRTREQYHLLAASYNLPTGSASLPVLSTQQQGGKGICSSVSWQKKVTMKVK